MANRIWPGRDEREQRLQVGRHPPGGVEQQVRVVGGDAPDPRQVADPGVGEDQPRVGNSPASCDGVQARAPGSRGRRGSAPAARARAASATSAGRPGWSSVNCSARGWSLIPLAPAARQRSASATGSSCGLTRQNGTSSPSDSRGGLDHHVVGRRVAVGLVHREHERAARAGQLERPRAARSGVCFIPSGSFWPRWVWASNSSSPGTCSSDDLDPGLDQFDEVHALIRTMKRR